MDVVPVVNSFILIRCTPILYGPCNNFEVYSEILWIQEKERKASKFGCYAVKTMGIIKILLRLLMAPL